MQENETRMKAPYRFTFGLVVLLALGWGANMAQAQDILSTPTGPLGTGKKNMSGTLEGTHVAEYRMPLQQGQTLSVLCHARKSSVGFFVKDPEGELLSVPRPNCAHKLWSMSAIKSGTYTVGVLQDHAAALKGQGAFYRLHLSAQ